MLAEKGFAPVPSKDVNDFDLRGRLWELLYALAAKRIFFMATDHFSDREFYEWLEKNWLPGEAADLPADSEWNCHVDVSESGTKTMTGEQLFLSYYADEEMRSVIQKDSPETTLPPKLHHPFTRDTYLPKPHAPISADRPLFEFDDESDDEDNDEPSFLQDDADDEDEDDEDSEVDDPLGLAAVDREIKRHSQQKRHHEQPRKPDLAIHAVDEEMREWIEEVIAKSQDGNGESLVRPIDLFRESDYTPMPAAELTEETIAPALWELLHEMSRLNLYIAHTDHYSDVQLYTEITRTVIHQKILIPEILAVAACYHDCLEHAAADPITLWLTYYADEIHRAKWKRSHPGVKLPEAKSRPHQRDWRLPQPPIRT